MQPDDTPDTQKEEEPVETPYTRLQGDVGGLISRVDQLDAMVGENWRVLLTLSFALGVVAALGMLQHREIKRLKDAFPG